MKSTHVNTPQPVAPWLPPPAEKPIPEEEKNVIPEKTLPSAAMPPGNVNDPSCWDEAWFTNYE
jgi:hypothetical protein